MMDGERFDCQKCCIGHWCDDDFRWPKSRGPASVPILIIKNVIESRTCFLPMVTEFSKELLHWRGHYHQHILPLAGGAQDQPAVFLDALNLIDGTVADIENKRAARKPRGRR